MLNGAPVSNKKRYELPLIVTGTIINPILTSVSTVSINCSFSIFPLLIAFVQSCVQLFNQIERPIDSAKMNFLLFKNHNFKTDYYENGTA